MALIDILDKSRDYTSEIFEFIKMSERNFSSSKTYKQETEKVLLAVFTPPKSKNPRSFMRLPSIKSSNLDNIDYTSFVGEYKKGDPGVPALEISAILDSSLVSPTVPNKIDPNMFNRSGAQST